MTKPRRTVLQSCSSCSSYLIPATIWALSFLQLYR